METYLSTPLACLSEWPLWKEIGHYHVTIPACTDIDVGASSSNFVNQWSDVLYDPNYSRDLRQKIRVEGCCEIAIYLKVASLIKTLTISLKFDEEVEAEEVMEAFLEVRGVEKVRCLVDKDEPIPLYRPRYARQSLLLSPILKANDGNEESYNRVKEGNLRKWEKIMERKTSA